MTDPPPLEEFRAQYEADDSIWWAIACGHHQNLFEEACEQLDEAIAERDALRVALRQWDDLGELVGAKMSDPEFRNHYLAAHLAREVEHERDTLRDQLAALGEPEWEYGVLTVEVGWVPAASEWDGHAVMRRQVWHGQPQWRDGTPVPPEQAGRLAREVKAACAPDCDWLSTRQHHPDCTVTEQA